MKKLATLLCAGAVLVAALVIPPSLAEAAGTAVVTMGPLEAPLPTPRVRVSNGHAGTVDVWFVRNGDPESARRLGSVAGSATRTFLLGDAAGQTRVVATSRDTHETLVSEVVAVDEETDIGLALAPALVDSRLEVQRLQVVREVR